MIFPAIWANAVRAKIEERTLALDAAPIVVDDLRFPSDWQVVFSLSGLIVTVRTPSVEADRTLIDCALQASGIQRLIPANGLFYWKPLHKTEFHWRDAPS